MRKMPTVQQIRMKMCPWWAMRTRQAAVAYRQWPTMVSASTRQARARRTQRRRQRRRSASTAQAARTGTQDNIPRQTAFTTALSASVRWSQGRKENCGRGNSERMQGEG
ncbi:hypothetical protein VPH35_088000 [Triticum aestivum]|uniref:Uncharacterized protein n=1 Tax=Triticum turgidum subsp. durum TaxID=4567 RepID=A0A9R0WZ00_TRITD|nr:unnamed protein product [Triticum turgidum subsp. durum]